MNGTNAWYIRSQSDGEIKGPFPGGQISQEMLLGRYKLDDEVSHDKEEWVLIRHVAEIVPDIFTENRDDPGFKGRLAAARRWADLTAANFMGADLSGASFHHANLSYANFRDAIILTTDFSDARLDHAIWVDGRVCKVNSIGTCN